MSYGLEEHSWIVFETPFAPRGKGRILYKPSFVGGLDGLYVCSNRLRWVLSVGSGAGNATFVAEGAEHFKSTTFMTSRAKTNGRGLWETKHWIQDGGRHQVEARRNFGSELG